MKVLPGELTFLRIRWEVLHPESGNAVALEATLCRAHREEIWDRYSGVEGLKQLGYSCDLCEGRPPGSA